jgi:hypothetical protein
VTPRSKARRTIARLFSNTSTPPKLCHRPSEIAGRRKPLLPQRRKLVRSYRSAAGL